MSKKIKMKRNSRRHYMKVNKIKQLVAKLNKRKSTKSATGKEHYNPSQEKSSKKDHQKPRPEKRKVIMTSTELLHPKNGGIINTGIKYMMYPLHFLRFNLFKKNSVSKKAMCEVVSVLMNSESSGKKTNNEEKKMFSRSKDDGQAENDITSKKRSSEESLKNTRSGSSTDTSNTGLSQGKDSKESLKDHDEVLAKRPLVVVVEEDSDSSNDEWSTASSMMIDDDSMDIERSMSLDSVIEPMDISMEECTYERSQIVMGPREKQNSTLSLDSEMARIFRRQRISTDDGHSSSNTLPKIDERPGGKNFLCRARINQSAVTVPLKSKEEEVNKEQKKKSSNLDTNNKFKESKREDVKYKETATQTDSTFLDDDIEMIPVDAKLPEKRSCRKHAVYRSHPNLHLYGGMRHDSNYVADNKDLNNGSAKIVRERVSSDSTSSSSTDLGFDEQVTPPESDTGTGRWHANVHDTITSYCMYNRAPPGFPKSPQNLPLVSYTRTDRYKVVTTSLQYNSYDAPSTPILVPRAPTPMRHLYYDYPEFMDLPTAAKVRRI